MVLRFNYFIPLLIAYYSSELLRFISSCLYGGSFKKYIWTKSRCSQLFESKGTAMIKLLTRRKKHGSKDVIFRIVLLISRNQFALGGQRKSRSNCSNEVLDARYSAGWMISGIYTVSHESLRKPIGFYLSDRRN